MLEAREQPDKVSYTKRTFCFLPFFAIKVTASVKKTTFLIGMTSGRGKGCKGVARIATTGTGFGTAGSFPHCEHKR